MLISVTILVTGCKKTPRNVSFASSILIESVGTIYISVCLHLVKREVTRNNLNSEEVGGWPQIS